MDRKVIAKSLNSRHIKPGHIKLISIENSTHSGIFEVWCSVRNWRTEGYLTPFKKLFTTNDREQALEYARIVQEIDRTNPIIKDLTRGDIP